MQLLHNINENKIPTEQKFYSEIEKSLKKYTLYVISDIPDIIILYLPTCKTGCTCIIIILYTGVIKSSGATVIRQL